MPFNVPLADPPAAGNLTIPVTGIPGAGAAAGVVSAIRDASSRSGVNFDLMLASARLESGLDPSAQASTSSATGLFQFIDQTWLDAVRQYGPQHGLAADAALVVRQDGHLTVGDPVARQRILDLRKNPDVASALAGDHLRGISDKLGLTLGRPPDATEVYLGHLLGSGGASQLLQAARTTPNEAAADLLPAAARANGPLFAAPDGTPYTVAQFMQHLHDRVARAYAATGSVMPIGPVNLAQTVPPAGSAAPAKLTTNPRHSRQPIERQAIANLSKVFARLDSTIGRGQSAGAPHHGEVDKTPCPRGCCRRCARSPAGHGALTRHSLTRPADPAGHAFDLGWHRSPGSGDYAAMKSPIATLGSDTVADSDPGPRRNRRHRPLAQMKSRTAATRVR